MPVLEKRHVNPGTGTFRSTGTCKKYWRIIDSGTASNRKIIKNMIYRVLDPGFTFCIPTQVCAFATCICNTKTGVPGSAGQASSAWAWPYCAFAPKWWVVWKSISTPSFEDENIFQKSATLVVSGIVIELQPTWPFFEKCSHLREKRKGLIFSRVCMVGCMGRISHTNLKHLYSDFRYRNFEKSHRTTGPPSDLRPDSWSWANSDLETTSRIYENGEDQGELSKTTVCLVQLPRGTLLVQLMPTRPDTGWDHVRLSWRRFYIGKYYAVTFYKYNIQRPDRDPGAVCFLDFSRSVFSSMSTQLGWHA